MQVAPQIVPTLEEARRMADDYTQEDVWLDYRNHGGTATQGTVEDWLREKRDLKLREYALLCKVINDHLDNEGKGRPLPDLPYLLIRPVGDDGAVDATSAANKQWCNKPGPDLRIFHPARKSQVHTWRNAKQKIVSSPLTLAS